MAEVRAVGVLQDLFCSDVLDRLHFKKFYSRSFDVASSLSMTFTRDIVDRYIG